VAVPKRKREEQPQDRLGTQKEMIREIESDEVDHKRLAQLAARDVILAVANEHDYRNTSALAITYERLQTMLIKGEQSRDTKHDEVWAQLLAESGPNAALRASSGQTIAKERAEGLVLSEARAVPQHPNSIPSAMVHRIVSLYRGGWKKSDIVRVTSTSEQTVSKYVRRHVTEGHELPPLPTD